jgi:biotin carboxylase
LRIDGAKLINPQALTALLQKLEHRGMFDVNGMLTSAGEFVFLEWTPRWGSGITEFFCHAAMDLGELLRCVATGEDCPLVMPEVEGKVVALVNTREQDNADNKTASFTMVKEYDITSYQGPYSFELEKKKSFQLLKKL